MTFKKFREEGLQDYISSNYWKVNVQTNLESLINDLEN